MVIKKWLTGATKRAGVDELIARKKYAKAVELLREEFEKGRRDARLRLQLADVLVLAGRKKEAVPILTGLADEFAVEGFAAKAISVLKKIQKLQPGQKDVMEKLAHLIITQGEAGDSMFVLTDGITKAFVRDASGHHTQVREMEEGTFFGEISILTGQPRTATVTAATRCELLELDRKTLDSITETHPHVREVLQQFCDERLKNA